MKPLLPLLFATLIIASVDDVSAQVLLRQSTARQIELGPFFDPADLAAGTFTRETGLTIAAADVILEKCAAESGTCGAQAAKNDNSACTHKGRGVYACALNATDTDTVGTLHVDVQVAGATPFTTTFQVVEEAVYDACCAASSAPVTVSSIWSHSDRIITGVGSGAIGASSFASGAITNTALADGAITADKIATNAITSGKIAADAIGASELASDAVSAIQSGLAMASALSAVSDSLTAVANAVTAIKAKTDNLPADPADDSDIDAALTSIGNAVTSIKTVVDGISDGSGSLLGCTFTVDPAPGEGEFYLTVASCTAP